MKRPVLLDLFCGAGGAGMGYREAGFHIIGMDIADQPHYPGQFIQTDVMKLRRLDKFCDLIGAVAIHASPPCQRYSDLAKRNRNAEKWPDLIEPTRKMLVASGRHYVIENVEGAPLIDPVTLCGSTFPGLRVLRHRLFETSFSLQPRPCHNRHPLVFTHDKRKAHYGKLDQNTSFVQVTGGGNCTVANKADAMGISWMTGKELNESIPPRYTRYVGQLLMVHLRESRAAA